MSFQQRKRSDIICTRVHDRRKIKLQKRCSTLSRDLTDNRTDSILTSIYLKLSMLQSKFQAVVNFQKFVIWPKNCDENWAEVDVPVNCGCAAKIRIDRLFPWAPMHRRCHFSSAPKMFILFGTSRGIPAHLRCRQQILVWIARHFILGPTDEEYERMNLNGPGSCRRSNFKWWIQATNECLFKPSVSPVSPSNSLLSLISPRGEFLAAIHRTHRPCQFRPPSSFLHITELLTSIPLVLSLVIANNGLQKSYRSYRSFTRSW